MAGKSITMSTIKQMLLLSQQGYSVRKIADMLPGISKNTVSRYLQKVKDNGWATDALLSLEDYALERKFSPGNPAYSDDRMEAFLKELPLYVQELSRKHVTRYQVWQEYKERHPQGYGKSQFFFHLKQNKVARKDTPTAVLYDTYNPGEKLMVDFAGDKMFYIDDDGRKHFVETFVATMPYSDYAFALCVENQTVEEFLYALKRCLEFLGGVPPIVVPDNLKSAVIRSHKYEPDLNAALQQMGNHYGFVVVPCQPRKPTQKALVEDQVRIVYRRIYAKLRDREFLSLTELNDAVEECLISHNRTRMQKRPYSREEHFHANEKALLKPLRKEEFEMVNTAYPKVQENGCVELRCGRKVPHYYSVPYQHIGKKAVALITRTQIRIIIDGACVATHIRDDRYGYTMLDAHMASNNLTVTRRSPTYYIDRARYVSEDFRLYVTEIFNPQRSNNPPEVFYRTCDMLLGLARQYGDRRNVFNATVRQCLELRVFRGKAFGQALKNMELQGDEPAPSDSCPTPTAHANMRGNTYFK